MSKLLKSFLKYIKRKPSFKDIILCSALLLLAISLMMFSDKIFDENDQLVEVHCAEFNEKYPSPLEFTFNLFGEEPFWDAELRVDSLSYTLPNNDTHQFDTDGTYI